MTTDAKITDRFWEELQAKPMVMLGIVGDADGHTQPMMAQFEGRLGPIWFFARNDSHVVEQVAMHSRALLGFTAPHHDLYASVQGSITREDNRKVVDRFWSANVAAWYDGGKDDPKLALLRFEPDNAKIWLGDAGFGTTIKAMFKGSRAVAEDLVAEVVL